MSTNYNDKVADWTNFDPTAEIPGEKIFDFMIYMLRYYTRLPSFGSAVVTISDCRGRSLKKRRFEGNVRSFRDALLGTRNAGGLIRPGESFNIQISPQTRVIQGNKLTFIIL